MSRPPSLLKPQTTPHFSLLLTSPFSLSTSHSLSPSRTRLKLSRKSSPLSSTLHSSSFQLSPQSQHHQEFPDDGDDEEEEHVVGDCLVFEEGIFEDPYLDSVRNSKTPAEVKPEDLIPEKWKEAQAEINITKKERRKMAQEMEFGRSVEKRKQSMLPIREVSVEDYKAFRDKKLSELKPVVLESPRFVGVEEEDGGESEEEDEVSVPTRVAPRNPRLAVYGVSMDDISEYFNSENYDPKAAKNPEGRRKLLTNEEKALLNMRKPDLSFATSGRWLPLHTLVASGEFYLVNTLLKHNTDINIENKDGLTALHKTIFSKKQAIFNYLLRESANPFVRDKEGATLMHYAVRAAATSMIKILLLYNVDINLQDNDGWTPLHLAVQTRRTDIVRLLLIKGADKTLKTQNGLTPLDLCLRCGQDTRTCEVIKQLKQEPKARKSP